MPDHCKTENFKFIQDEINRFALEKRQTRAIIMDEANYIGTAILSDLKILFNFEIDSSDRAVLNAAGGSPRMINKPYNACLFIGNSANLNIITADAVMQAISNCELG